MKKMLFTGMISALSLMTVAAQCPMCGLVTQSADREAGRVSTLNSGILYLFLLPYIGIGIVGYVWYKRYKQKKSEEKS